MGTACEAVKGHRWEEAEEMLKRIQSMVHQLRVHVRDESLPLERLSIGTPEGQDDSRRDGSR
jgi:NifU-like protein involved in Fe-S cluster formation